MNNKRYTTQTFTKRVDHAGGRHRPIPNMPEPALCTGCGSIYSDRRWTAMDNITVGRKHLHWRPAASVLCPACERIENHIVGGYVTLSGEFLANHRDEIDNLITNEADRALEDNALSKIISRDDFGDTLLLKTTTEHLAQRLGHALQQAYDGKTAYDFSHENKVARVRWHRDE